MKRKIAFLVLSFGVLGGAFAVALLTTPLGSSFHVWAHGAGLCSGGDTCAIPGVDVAVLSEYSPDEIIMVRHIADLIVSRGSIEFSQEDAVEMEAVTGLDFDTLGRDALTEARIRTGVIAVLQQRGIDIAGLLGAGRCARFSACSIHGDLSGATGSVLARYEEEKQQDGQAYENRPAKDFSLPATDGSVVSLSDYRGRPVAIAFLAGHCDHSLRSLTILEDLRSRYSGERLVVLPVYVNSGRVEDVDTWRRHAGVDLPLLVSEEGETPDLPVAFDFRMVPSFYLIDGEGMITMKLVGQKSEAALRRAIDELLPS